MLLLLQRSCSSSQRVLLRSLWGSWTAGQTWSFSECGRFVEVHTPSWGCSQRQIWNLQTAAEGEAPLGGVLVVNIQYFLLCFLKQVCLCSMEPTLPRKIAMATCRWTWSKMETLTSKTCWGVTLPCWMLQRKAAWLESRSSVLQKTSTAGTRRDGTPHRCTWQVTSPGLYILLYKITVGLWSCFDLQTSHYDMSSEGWWDQVEPVHSAVNLHELIGDIIIC